MCKAAHVACWILAFLVHIECYAPFQDPNYYPSRDVMVHMFEWRWEDIAQECERFLAPMGYAGVQVSPVNENAILNHPQFKPEIIRPWYERYQPVSYLLTTRSGNESEFRDMVQRCNQAGVRIYVDAIINHMARTDLPAGTQGTAGSLFDATIPTFQAVPYGIEDFNSAESCPNADGTIHDYNNPRDVRNCRLEQLNDLDHSRENVRNTIANFMNHLIDMGVAGFRIDAAKHMWPENLKTIYEKLNHLSTDFFPPGTRPLIYQEVIDLGGEAISSQEYIDLGRVTEFKYGIKLGEALRGKNQLKWLKNFGEAWGFLKSDNAFVFIDNHDNQRGHGAAGPNILSFWTPDLYKKALTFMLAWPYGLKQIISSYRWERDIQNSQDLNDWVGPPHDENYNTLPVAIGPYGTCDNGWVCEHRWPEVAQMVRMSTLTVGQPVTLWWDNDDNQIAFSRGNKAFFALNNNAVHMSARIKTDLPPGHYCDVTSGLFTNDTCKGRLVTVDSTGYVYVNLPDTKDSTMALHIQARILDLSTTPDNTQDDYQRTIVMINLQDANNVFIRGGISHERKTDCQQDDTKCYIPIRYKADNTDKGCYSSWKVQDQFLNWVGAEPDQGRCNDASASGSPLFLLTESHQVDPVLLSYNKQGLNFWIFDVEMDCSKTDAGWFEFKTVSVDGVWADDIHQHYECNGNTYRAQIPFESRNYVSMCGKINVFNHKPNECIINDIL